MYGKVVYIDHPNGFTSVYAHLKDFSTELDNYVRGELYRSKKSTIKKFPKKGELKVGRGELIGYSGNTGGSSGPHLHFEIRDSETQNVLNPHLFGYKLSDSKEPVIKKIILYTLNKFERFENNKLKENIPFKIINNSKVLQIQ